jgi:hypothetical protein
MQWAYLSCSASTLAAPDATGLATAYFRQSADAAWYVGELGLKLSPRYCMEGPLFEGALTGGSVSGKSLTPCECMHCANSNIFVAEGEELPANAGDVVVVVERDRAAATPGGAEPFPQAANSTATAANASATLIPESRAFLGPGRFRRSTMSSWNSLSNPARMC